MSIWTSKWPLTRAAVACVFVVSGCFEHSAAWDRRGQDAIEPVVALGVLDGLLTVAGPEGYCIDPTATRERGEEAFVLLRHCEDLPGQPVLSVSVSNVRLPAGDIRAQLERLAQFLLAPDGQAHLSRRGRPADLTILSHDIAEGVLWMELEDRGNPRGFIPEYTRAVLPLAGRLVTLAALSPTPAPPSRADRRRALAELITVLKRRNLD